MRCKECEVQDICGKTLSICGYCNHFEEDMQNEECACWNCNKDSCRFKSKFNLVPALMSVPGRVDKDEKFMQIK